MVEDNKDQKQNVKEDKPDDKKDYKKDDKKEDKKEDKEDKKEEPVKVLIHFHCIILSFHAYSLYRKLERRKIKVELLYLCFASQKYYCLAKILMNFY